MRDEYYVIDLCDAVLGIASSRQHRFPFLTGDPGRDGSCRRLPVDAFYEPLALAVEYRERQHSEPVAFMDRRQTVSGCTRGEQRRRYDERRRIVLPQQGIRLVELDYSMFAHNGQKRLRRDRAVDELVVRSALQANDQLALQKPSYVEIGGHGSRHRR
jgi:hypothetical protein